MKLSKADYAITTMSEKDIVRFWSYVKRTKTCWLWLGGKQPNSGHGVFSIRHISVLAHRVSFYLGHGYLPKKPRLVMHDCQNSGCVREHHLLDGTTKENGNYPDVITKLRGKEAWWKNPEDHPRLGTKHTKESKLKISVASSKRKRDWHGRLQ
jgi:hypothetical protein